MSEANAYTSTLPTARRTLPNGLRVIVREDHSAPVVAVVTWVKAGYFDEPDDVIGISHVLEHMYFKGTPRRGAGEIARATKSAGGYLNAGTIYDHTSYYTVLPSSSLEDALDIQSDALLNSAIDADELATELQVIIQEARRKLDNPRAVAEESLFELMHDHHRIRRWRIGLAEDLAKMTREQIVAYYRGMYSPANTVVVIAGDVDTEHAFERAAHYYGRMTAASDVRSIGPEEPVRRGFRYREMSGDVVQTTIEWGWRTPGTLHPDTPVLDVMALVLGQGRASRLYRNVRDTGLVTAISAHNYTPSSIGVFTVSAECAPERAMDAMQAIAATIRSMRDQDVSDAEIDRARSMLGARLVRRQETMEGQANLLAEWEALGGYELHDEYARAMLAVTPADIQRVARQYLDDDLGALLLYRPSNAPMVAEDAAEISAKLFANAEIDERPMPALDAAAPADAEKPKRTRPRRVEDGVRIYEQAGATVVIAPRPGIPLISMSLVFRGGSLQESASEAGITSLMMRASVKGTTRRSADVLALASEALGTSIGFAAGADSFEWGATVPAHHFDAGLDLLLDAALDPVFPAAEVARERDIMLRDLAQTRDDMYQYPMRLALEAAFGAHPYGFSLDTIERSVAAIDASMLQAWHRNRVLAGEPWFFVTGDVSDADAFACRIFAALRAIKPDSARQADRRPVWPTTAQVRCEQRNKQQTAIALAFPGPDRNDSDADALRLLAAAVSGLGGRMFEELRSRRSLAYAISAFPIARWRAGAFVAYIGTSPARETEARAGMMEQLALLASERISDEEVQRAQNYAVGAWQIRNQTNAARLGEIASAMLFGRGLEEIRTFEERTRAITAEDMRAAAERWITPERVVEGIVRGSSDDSHNNG